MGQVTQSTARRLDSVKRDGAMRVSHLSDDSIGTESQPTFPSQTIDVSRHLISMNRTHTGVGTCTLALVGVNSPVD